MFVKKINKNLMFIFLKVIICMFLFSYLSSIKAHEMWIEPVNYSLKIGEKVLANEMVGQNFKGNKYAYLDSSYEKLEMTQGNNTQTVKSRLGDLPAVQQESSEEGLYIITAETTTSELSYKKFEKFEKFIQSEGLNWVFKEHKNRDLPQQDFKEVYRRSAKALLKVGDGEGKDKAHGLPLEWVVLTNPYTSEGDIVAELLWQGVPAVNMHVNVFNKNRNLNKNKNKVSESEVIKTTLRTDENGRIEIPRANGGSFLINSVKMIQPDIKLAKETGAVWESIWGSLTYELE